MPLLAAARRILRSAGSVLFPPHCVTCGEDTEPGVYVCPACLEDLQPLQEPMCARCSWPFFGAITEAFVCGDCDGRKVHYDCAVAAYRARGVARELIHKFKYERKRYLRIPLARWLGETLNDPRILAKEVHAFVPVPLHPTRKREREFNQAEELSALLSQATGIPSVNALRRVRYTTTQTRLSREERMENLRGAFHARHTDEVNGRDIVLVDDVFTTGSTVEECSRVLRQAGAASVRVITVARG
jgi:competence protein ComFC